MEKWVVLDTEYVLSNPWIKVRRDRCRMENGRVIDDYFLVEIHDFVMIFALTVAGELLMVRQYQHGAGQIMLALPAGMIEPEDGDPAETARRELREETGYEAKCLTHLTTVFVSSTKATTRAHLYLAGPIRKVGEPQPDAQENIETVCVPIDAALRMIRDGQITEAITITATFHALLKLGMVTAGPLPRPECGFEHKPGPRF